MDEHMDEWKLLHRFAHEGAQEAFAELVHRHLNFVYSSARRQVRSAQLAEEIAQTVFLKLAQEAARLKPGAPLAGWLYTVTRRTALNVLRGELRRQAREHAAYEASAMQPAPDEWEKLEPSLEEALDTLHPRDRSALLLRYFENKTLRDVGAALGASEDAAQKRVSRALDQLRTFFTRRGVTISAAGLASQLSARAVETAPAVLGGTITTAVGTLATTASTPLGFLAMTTLQKTIAVGALVAIAASLLDLRATSGQREQTTALSREAARLSARANIVGRERDAFQAQLVALQAAAPPAASPTSYPEDPLVTEIVSRIVAMKAHLARHPELAIPELVLLQESDWYEVVRERPLEAETDLRAALALLRYEAKGKLQSPVADALTAYAAAHGGHLPGSMRELQPYIRLRESDLSIKVTVAPEALVSMLDRYELKARGTAADVPDQAELYIERDLVEREYDLRVRYLRTGSSTNPARISTARTIIHGSAWTTVKYNALALRRVEIVTPGR